MYKCELVNNGMLIGAIIREGGSIDEVRAILSLAEGYPEGFWNITEVQQ